MQGFSGFSEGSVDTRGGLRSSGHCAEEDGRGELVSENGGGQVDVGTVDLWERLVNEVDIFKAGGDAFRLNVFLRQS